MTVYLKYKPDKIIDRLNYLNTYSTNTGYKMLNGTPIIVNIEGSYINASDIPELLVSRKHAKQVEGWLQEIKNPFLCIDSFGPVISFKWKR